ncbi:ULP1 protease C-terminal catalytic domain-containing protein [Cryptosporidium andersoni]|uniref:ULP1 protease C-terminal catalytic domain-containing protein n=1 Tax=Cryptosporidium andersoni TaxID=117008 RepID=A0A1J4MYA4_9CRYT|nr:ULP1 protease C-terminal catalytic domain-containing protein [Cryptosporidium andersoni]
MNKDKIRLRSFILDTKNALTQLEGCGYLDDSILDFFLGFIKEFCISHNNYTWNIFSTLFNVLLSKCNKKEEYINMRRWIKRLTFPLLLHDFILIPIHSNTCHWWILIICFPKKGIKIINDSNKDKNINILNKYNENDECILKSSIGWIICLDSLGYTNVKKSEKQATIINILKFLNIEYNYNNEYKNMRKSGFIFSENISNDWYIIYNPYNIPNQYNGYDCGLYLIEYIHWIFHYNIDLINSMIKKTLKSNIKWFSNNWIKNRRISLKLIIIKIRDNPDWIYNIKIKQEILSIFDNGLEIEYNNNELKYLTYNFSNSCQNNYNSELYIPNNSGPISSFLANKLDTLSNRLNKYKRDS